MRASRNVALLLLFFAIAACAAGADSYPDLRDCEDPELKAAIEHVLRKNHIFWRAKAGGRASLVVADVTDLREPKVASFEPELMMYAASLPKIGIIHGVFVEVQAGRLEIDEETRQQLIQTVKVSSNRDASALLYKVGFERLAEILQDPAHGALYDPKYGGGIWVGKAYDKSPVWRRDPIQGISHAASAMQAARFYYGALTGTLIDEKYGPLLAEIFGKPGVKHKFVKGLKGRDREIFRKSGTWRSYHADSGVIYLPDDSRYIVVALGRGDKAGQGLVELIKQVDDVMEERANLRAAAR